MCKLAGVNITVANVRMGNLEGSCQVCTAEGKIEEVKKDFMKQFQKALQG